MFKKIGTRIKTNCREDYNLQCRFYILQILVSLTTNSINFKIYWRVGINLVNSVEKEKEEILYFDL